MKAKSPQRLIGFRAMAWQEVALRRLEGVLRYIEEHKDLGLIDFRSLTDRRISAESPPPWRNRVAGVVFMSGVKGSVSEFVAWLQRGGVPVVSMTSEWLHPMIPSVDTDHEAVIRTAADYLLGLGYERCLYVGSAATSFAAEVSARRGSIFRKLLAARGVSAQVHSVRYRLECSSEDSKATGRDRKLLNHLQATPKPLAVFAITDVVARAVCALCQDLGLAVPDDVAVLGVGDQATSRCHSPTLSSVQTDSLTIGYRATELLHHLIDGGRAPAEPLLIKPRGIVERESTRPDYDRQGHVLRAVQFIRDHACEGIGVGDVMRIVPMSRRAFEMAFARRVGHSPGAEIHEIRMKRAKALLSETALTVTQIAAMTGFSDLAPFSRAFRASTGASPIQYRARQR